MMLDLFGLLVQPSKNDLFGTYVEPEGGLDKKCISNPFDPLYNSTWPFREELFQDNCATTSSKMGKSPSDGWEVSEEEEYRRVPEIKRHEVDNIMEWAAKQPHLPKFPRIRAIMFIRACDFSIERAKETIEVHYTMRTRCPELFANLDYFGTTIQNSMKKILVGILPNTDETGNYYIYYKLLPTKISEWNPNELAKLVFMTAETTHLRMGSGSGYHFIADLKNVTIPLLLTIPITTIQNILKYLQEASHYKIKSLHFFNGGVVMDKLLTIMKPFLKEDVRKVLFMHPSWETLSDHFSPKFIPSDYGGTGPSVQEIHDQTKEIFAQKSEWFKQEGQLVVDEKKRLASTKNSSQMEGSFRKLALD